MIMCGGRGSAGCRDEKPIHCIQSIKTRRNRKDTLISVLPVLTLMAIIKGGGRGLLLYLFHWLRLFHAERNQYFESLDDRSITSELKVAVRHCHWLTFVCY